MEQELAKLKGRKLAVVCVGNPMKGDDGFGQAVAARLVSGLVFDAGNVPENILNKVAAADPEVVIFVDAADFGSAPGTIRLATADEIAGGDFSTHAAPLSVSAEFLKMACGADSILLAVQAKTTAFGTTMSVEVVKAAESIAEILSRILR